MSRNDRSPPKPVRGLPVDFYSSFPAEQSNGSDIHPAVITRVNDDVSVNLMVLPDGGTPYPLMGVQLSGSFDPIKGFPHRSWAWPR